MNLPIGTTYTNKPVCLFDSDLSAHVHGVGASRKGKSKLIEHITREFIKRGYGFCLIDPHGHLYADLVAYLAYIRPRNPIVLFNPSYPARVVGFNPFCLKGEKSQARIATKVDRMVAATLTVWNETETSAPRLEKWLRCLYHILIEQDLSIDVARYFLSFHDTAIRDAIVSRIASPAIRDQWNSLIQGKTEAGYIAQLESTANRLFKLLTNPTIRRIAGIQENAIDVESIINTNTILLVNLQSSDVLSAEAARILGTLLVNELWEIFRQRTKYQAHRIKPFFLILDEFQSFATPDISEMLDQGAKFGIRLLLFHQRLSQLVSDLQGSVKNAHTRFIFGGLSRAEVAAMLEGAASDSEDLSTITQNPPRSFTLYRAGQPLVLVAAPPVTSFPVRFDKIEAYVAEQTAAYLTVSEVDAILDQHQPTQAAPYAPAPTAPVREYGDEDFFE